LYLDHQSLRADIDADAIAEAARRGARSRAKVAASPLPTTTNEDDAAYAAAKARLLQRRTEILASRCRPDTRHLTDRWHRRKQRQESLRRARRHRTGLALLHRNHHEAPRPTLATLAGMDGVPVWALEAAEHVTGRSYVAEHVGR
jgi:hypothetical protein